MAIKHLVLWGGGGGNLDSFRHIHKAFYRTAGKLGIPSVWLQDDPDNAKFISRDSTIFTVDIWNKFIPYVEGANYVFHNYNGDHWLCQRVAPENTLRLQVWTYSADGDAWDERRFFDRPARTLFQPWGTDLFSEEFLDPVFNQHSREAVYVGAIWSEPSPYGELGNKETMQELKQVLRDHGMGFNHLTQISDEENIAAVRSARLTPAVAGNWQVEHGYIPCRVFKNPSYGAAMFTNVPTVNELFGSASVPGDTLGDLVENVLRLKRQEYEDLVVAQQRVAARYTFRENLLAIGRALEEGK
jgi:hypothetical protein